MTHFLLHVSTSMNMTGFNEIAIYLTHPLVLLGVLLLLISGVCRQLMSFGMLFKVNKRRRRNNIRLVSRSSFKLACIVLLVGFGLLFYRTGNSIKKEEVLTIDADKVAKQLYVQLVTKEQPFGAQEEQIAALTEAITALPQVDTSVAHINSALRGLQNGTTQQAQVIFAEDLKAKETRKEGDSKVAAATARHLGALAVLNDTSAALAAYQKSVQLDPDNVENWSKLGQVLYSTGQLDKAKVMYTYALEINDALGRMKGIAKAITGLGNIAFTRSDLEQAQQMYQKALVMNKVLGSKKEIANDYSNLGKVAFALGNLDKAEEMHKASLVFNELFGSKEHLMLTYSNLGKVYKARGELDKAEQMERKAALIDEALVGNGGVGRRSSKLGDLYEMGTKLAKVEN